MINVQMVFLFQVFLSSLFVVGFKLHSVSQKCMSFLQSDVSGKNTGDQCGIAFCASEHEIASRNNPFWQLQCHITAKLWWSLTALTRQSTPQNWSLQSCVSHRKAMLSGCALQSLLHAHMDMLTHNMDQPIWQLFPKLKCHAASVDAPTATDDAHTNRGQTRWIPKTTLRTVGKILLSRPILSVTMS